MTVRCDLTPATLKQGKSELGACLTLVSPSGLTAEDRREWLAVAMQTLSGIPADLLADGCAAARLKCRFPSEIVPTIIETIGRRWKWRKEAEAERNRPKELPAPEPEYVGPEAIRNLLKSIGNQPEAGAN